MSDEDKKTKLMKLVFAPGCFDDFEGTQEDLDSLIEEIQAKFADGSMEDMVESAALDDLSEEEFDELREMLEKIESTPRTRQ
jgi:hypothetical protein